jgi:hypothetical protein
MTSRRPIRAASAAGARPRGAHSLAPEHLGEAAAAATVAVIVGGVALVITGIGMVAMAFTLGSRYGADPPPNLGTLALVPSVAGVLAILLGGALVAGGIAVLGDVRRARQVTGVLAGATAALGALAAVQVMVNAPADPVLATALTVATLVFGIATVLLLRPRR